MVAINEISSVGWGYSIFPYIDDCDANHYYIFLLQDCWRGSLRSKMKTIRGPLHTDGITILKKKFGHPGKARTCKQKVDREESDQSRQKRAKLPVMTNVLVCIYSFLIFDSYNIIICFHRKTDIVQ